MAITTDTGAKKIAGTDNWRDIFDDHNDTVDAYDSNIASLADGLAIVATGNIHAAIAAGQYVYVRAHSTLAAGLYKATTAIATNGTLSTSNLTADGSGGLNDLKASVDSLNSNKVNVSDIVNNLISTEINKPLSAAQGLSLNLMLRCAQYNASTDRNVQSNRTAVMDFLITNYFSKNYHFAMVRYEGGYYFGYICIGEYGDTLVVEILHGLSEKVIFWRKSNGVWTKNGAIT